MAATWPGTRVLTGAGRRPGRRSRSTGQPRPSPYWPRTATTSRRTRSSPPSTLADGPLLAYELRAGQVPDHVVLSACELGQATVRPGDESLGLTSVLLQLGARCVVSGVAEVADDLAAEVMVGYHRRLAAGADSATALADAAAADATGRCRSCASARRCGSVRRLAP